MFSWEITSRNRVLVCILHVEQVTFAWAQGLRRLRVPGPEPEGITAMPFDHARNAGCQMALDRGCDYLFFLDSDVIPPDDAIHRLLARGLPIVSGVYCRRSPPHMVPVAQRDRRWVTQLPGPGEDPLIEVDVVGAGCLLIHRSVLERLPPQRPGKRWFDWRADLQGLEPPGRCMSEDFTFCLHARECGYKVMLDTSIRCRHLGIAESDYGVYAPLGALPRPV